MTQEPVMVHLTVRPAAGGKWVRVFGELVYATPYRVTIERDIYDAWRCTSKLVDMTVDRNRIMRSSIELPQHFDRSAATT